MNKGFTFIELLLALVILGGLVMLFLPRYAQTVKQEHQKQVDALEQVRALQNTLNHRVQLQQRQLDRLDGLDPVPPKKAPPPRARAK